ncbi:MAG: polysaccharide deacetylase family protein [Gaiellaceae bacterium]
MALVGVPLSSPIELLIRHSSRRVGVALIYHSVDPVQGEPERELVPPHGSGLFEAQVLHLTRRYRVVPADRLLQSVMERKRGDRFPVAITFDDDLQCHEDVVLPILLRAGATATFFLSGSSLERPFAFWWERLQRAMDSFPATLETSPSRLVADRATLSIHEIGRIIERMSPAERDVTSAALAESVGPDPPGSGLRAKGVRALHDQGMGIGFHTLRHDPLPSLDADALERALTSGRDELEAITGRKLTTIAYPHGHVDSRVAAAARSAGFELGFTTRIQPVHPSSDPLLLGRLSPSYKSIGHFAVQLLWLVIRRRYQ